jgi:hypothetical protein
MGPATRPRGEGEAAAANCASTASRNAAGSAPVPLPWKGSRWCEQGLKGMSSTTTSSS